MQLPIRFVLALATVALAACTERREAAPPVKADQLGGNLCNIAPPASKITDNSIGAQIGLDLSKIAKIGVSGNVGATINDKVSSLFQAIPQRDVVCQMLLQTIACASAMNNQPVVAAMTTQVSSSCHSEKPPNSPERAQILERINLLLIEIAAQGKQIDRLDPKTQAAGKEWQDAKARAEAATDGEEKARLTAIADKLEITYSAAYRTEEWFRDEKLKREREVASLRAKVQ